MATLTKRQGISVLVPTKLIYGCKCPLGSLNVISRATATGIKQPSSIHAMCAEGDQVIDVWGPHPLLVQVLRDTADAAQLRELFLRQVPTQPLQSKPGTKSVGQGAPLRLNWKYPISDYK